MRDNFRYSSKVLRCIAENYSSLYEDGLCFSDRVIDSFELAEFVADFDFALSSLGQNWDGINGHEFKDFRSYSRFQRIVIADILGIPDNELIEKYHFINPERLRGISYSRMRKYLNGDVITMANIVNMHKQLTKKSEMVYNE
jgi:hypothetical protein